MIFYIHNMQEVGCLFGALSNLWVGDKLGRRRTIVVGGGMMIVGSRAVCGPLRAPAEFLTGAILQTSAFSFVHLIFARIFTGYGNGLIVSDVPTHASSPAENRFVDIYGADISCGALPIRKEGPNVRC
jgi:MFS family permease